MTWILTFSTGDGTEVHKDRNFPKVTELVSRHTGMQS